MESIELSKLSKKNLIGIVVAAVIIIAGLLTTVAIIKSSSASTHTQTSSITPTTHSGSECTESGHGAQITQAHQESTSKNPWGIAIDATHGFVWVAEPACNIDP